MRIIYLCGLGLLMSGILLFSMPFAWVDKVALAALLCLNKKMNDLQRSIDNDT